jgi:hypothetical protein
MSGRHLRLSLAALAVTVVCGLLVFGLVLALTSRPPHRFVSAAPQQLALAPDRRPCIAASGITQSPDGRIDGCVAIGDLRPGRYAVTLRDQFFTGQSSVSRSWQGPAVRVSLSPSSGPPGTLVRVRGSIERAVPAQTRAHLTRLGSDVLGVVYWDGPDGLMLDAEHFHWTSPSSFVAVIAVPSAPWVQSTRSPAVAGVRSGSYPISVMCVTGNGGCAFAPEGSARFTLRVARPTGWCRSSAACARLVAYPADAPAGAIVRVSGYAPLLEFDDGGSGFLGAAALTRSAGGRTGVRLMRSAGRRVIERIGPAPLVVLGRPYLAQLGRIRPREIIAGGATPIADDPADLRIVAWCAGDAIDVSQRGRLTHVSTRGVDAVLRRLHGMAPVRGAASPPGCTDVMPLSATAMLAAFSGGLPRFKDTIPPVVYYALETRDGGRSWAALPVPKGTTAAEFGGFRPDGRGAEAVFAASGPANYGPDATHPLAERTDDSGVSWSAATLGCPRSGACVTLGPFLPGNCAQGISTQYLLRSADHGLGWRRAAILDHNMFACGDVQLASFGGRDELLVNAISPYPLQLSSDGGVSWHNLSMPPPARLQTPSVGLSNDFGPGGITVLSDGALLLTGGGAYTGGWQLLKPRATSRCEVAGSHATWQFAQQATRITLIAGKLWWLTYGQSSGNAPTPIHRHTLPLSAVHCG